MALLNLMFSVSSFLASVSDGVSIPKGLWEFLIIKVFGFISNYGLRIVIFILLLKLLLLPLDIFQRYKMRKNAKLTEALKPQMDKLKHQYANDPRMLSSKQMELNRKSGYSYFSSCIPMVLTLVIFISLFSGMRNISQYMIFRQYAAWYDVYSVAILDYENQNPSYKEEKQELLDKIAANSRLILEIESQEPPVSQEDTDKLMQYITERTIWEAELAKTIEKSESYAQEMVLAYNDENADSFLWIKSLWQPDVLWAKPIHSSKSAFESSVGDYAKLSKDKGNVGEDTLSDMLGNYDKVTKKLVESSDNKQNGLLILVILSFLLSVASQFIMQKLQKKSGQFDSGAAMSGGMLKFMMFVMPAIVAVFALQYTAAFALYMVVNSAMGIIINIFTTVSMNLYDSRQNGRIEDVIVSYGRPDPNSESKTKKKIGKVIKNSGNSVVRHGRPDPNQNNKDTKK